MTTFDQRGQNVKYQYNAGENINFLSAQNKVDALTQLTKLRDEIISAVQNGALPSELGKNIQDKLEQAIILANTPKPNKKSMLSYLDEIRITIRDVASMGGFITALIQAAEMIKRLF
jgi:hypothetical protein